MRAFFSSLVSLAKAHPLAFVLFLFAVVMFLGGAVWWVIGKVFALVNKVPGGSTLTSAIDRASSATGS